MSVAGKYTTLYDIMERVHRAGIHDFTEEEAKEWIWEIISLLGVPTHYVDRVAILPVENARALLPYDLYDLTSGGIRDYYTKLPLIKETNIFYNSEAVGGEYTPILFETVGESVVYIDGVQQKDQDAYLQSITYTDYDIETYTYKINDGFIYTGFKSGIIELGYKAFPVDNDGSPMIEDNFKIIRAVINYIKKQVVDRKFFIDEATLQMKKIIDQDYSFSVASAKSDSNYGSVSDWDAIKDRWLRLRRDGNLSKVGFNGLSSREGLSL